jgi:sugar lactone lactonase YvrE
MRTARLVLIVFVIFGLRAVATAQESPRYTISTVAGGALRAVPQDATAVSIGNPTGIAADAAGNIYFTGPSVVFKLDPGGLLTRVAGKGGGGYSGDGGPAREAQLNFPRAAPWDGLDWDEIFSNLAVDSMGSLYIADTMNARIRKVDTNGTITTVPGTERWPGSGVAVDRNGDVYGVSAWSGIRKFSASGQVTITDPRTGIGTASSYSAAFDNAGNLYIPDTFRCSVQRIDADGGITLIAGGAPANQNGLSPCGFSGDGGPATAAALRSPYGVALDAAGNVYIADTGNHRIRKVSPDGIINTVAGGGYSGDWGPATDAKLNSPHGVAVDNNGNVYIADTENFRIRKVSSDGIITTVAGNGLFNESGDAGPASAAQLNFINNYTRGLPWGQGENWNANLISVDAAGAVNSIDAAYRRIRSIHPSGIIDTVVGPVNISSNAAVDAAGNRYVADCCRIQRFAPNGVMTTVATFPPDPPYLGDGYSPLSCNFICGKTVIRSVAVDGGGNIYFSNATNVFRLSTDGTVTTIAGNGTYGYSGDGGVATAAQLSFPAGIAVDDAGNIYIADAGNNAVRVLTVAQQPTSLSANPTVVKQGECVTVTVGNGSRIMVDVQYRFENGPLQIIRQWPLLDEAGNSKICTDVNTAPGNYTFLSIRNSSNPGWVGIQTTITVKERS